MPDTVRTLAALQGLLADNVAGDIGAQNVRDFLVSVFPPQFSGASVTKTGAQTLTTATGTSLTWDAEDFDTDTYHDNAVNNNRLTIPVAGYYQIGATIRWEANAAGSRQLLIRDDAGVSLVADYRFANEAGGAVTTQGTSFIILAAASDWFEITAQQSSGGDLDVQTTHSRFWIVRLGQAPA